jgi:hypothetical protein
MDECLGNSMRRTFHIETLLSSSNFLYYNIFLTFDLPHSFLLSFTIRPLVSNAHSLHLCCFSDKVIRQYALLQSTPNLLVQLNAL